jgi:hypothetical protein
MGFVTIKHLRDGLTFIGCERCDVNERFDALLSYRSNHSASVSMADKDDGAGCSFEPASQRVSVVA